MNEQTTGQLAELSPETKLMCERPGTFSGGHRMCAGCPTGIFTKMLTRISDEYEIVAGNAYLAGAEDPYEGLTAVRDAVYHVHAKDISMQHGAAERGKVTGTPVGCACGDGVVDWPRVFSILAPLDREIVFSVECGTVEQAARSLAFLRREMGPRLVE